MANSQQAQAFCSTTTWPRQRRRRRQRSPMPALLPVVRLFETLLGSGGGRLPPPGSTGPLYFGQHPRPLPRCRWLPPPPKSRSTLPGNPAPSALATPPRDAPPRRPTLLVPAPSALRLSRLLMEEAGFFDEGANIRRPPPPPTCNNAPPPRNDEGGPDRTPLRRGHGHRDALFATPYKYGRRACLLPPKRGRTTTRELTGR